MCETKLNKSEEVRDKCLVFLLGGRGRSRDAFSLFVESPV